MCASENVDVCRLICAHAFQVSALLAAESVSDLKADAEDFMEASTSVQDFALELWSNLCFFAIGN